MAWGNIESASSDLVRLHLFLTNELSAWEWTKTQIWDSRLSTHAWKPIIGPELAIDIALTHDSATITLVSRDETWSERVNDALLREGIKYFQNQQHKHRFQLTSVPKESSVEELAKKVATSIRGLRTALEAALRDKQVWEDPESGTRISYIVKPERRRNPAVIFFFTSIRTKSHWVDFGGPGGAALQTNRARIVFLLDEFEEQYTYLLARNADTSIHEATVRFISSYVEAEGIDWRNVTLAGMSKGGTGAIATAAKLPNCEVVAVAPQLSLGAYLAESRQAILTTITGKTGDEAAATADRILWDIFEVPSAGSGISKLTILTSQHDEHCTDQIPRLAEALQLQGKLHVYTDTGTDTPSHLKTVHFHASGLVSILGEISTKAAAELTAY